VGKKRLFSFFLFVLFLWQNHTAVAQSQSSVEKRADQAFAQQNYSAALTDYRQLLAKDQQNPKLNFCYGVCIFEVQQHFEAAKYFDVVLGLKQIPDPLLYYYRAQIYQEQYFFNQALEAYETYQKLTLEQKNKKEVSAQIAECKRALEEITSFQRLPLLSIATTQSKKFYLTYPFGSEDYTFYEAPEVHSKNNTKHQHIPVYAYKRGMKYRILASYGPKGDQLDLYLQRKDANNNWGELSLISGGVNGLLSDETYGFYDPNTQVLYFSSTANSIGASDLFKASFDLNTNTAKDIEKMPYPYSSPTADLFYVTDPTQQQAYFATTRQGKVGQYEIYTLQLDQPAQANFVFAGAFSNELDPLSKTMSLYFISNATSEKYGPFVSDAEGNYTVALPAKGDFQLELEVAGASKIYTTRFSIPQVPSGKTLQQQIRYSSDEYGKEKWQVLNQLLDTDPAEQISNISKLQMNVARGSLLQSKQSLTANTSSEQVNLGLGWGLAPQDTAAFVATLTDTLLAAEVSLENQVRLMELLRQDFEKQLNAREALLAELSALLSDPNTQNVAAQKAQVLSSLKELEAELAFTKRWIEINQAANIPDLVLLDTLQQINERNQALLLLADTTALINSWQQSQAAIAQYLQIAAFDGASAFETAQLDDQLRLQKIIKEENVLKTQQQQLAQQIKKLQTDLALQSKKDQALTQQTIASLQRDLSQTEVLAKQLAQAREVQAEKTQVYNQTQLKASYLKEAENQALPKVNFQSTYEELLAQHAQQESLSENLKSEATSNPEVTSNPEETTNSETTSNSTENGNVSTTNPENGNVSSTNPENGNLSSTNSNSITSNPEVTSNLETISNPEETTNSETTSNSTENGNISTTNPENGNLSSTNSNSITSNPEVTSTPETISNPEETTNSETTSNSTENGNVSTTNPENGNLSSTNSETTSNSTENGNVSTTNPENGNLSSTNSNSITSNPEVTSTPETISNPEETTNSETTSNSTENGNISTTNPENGNLSSTNSNSITSNPEVTSTPETISNPEETTNSETTSNSTENGNVSTTNPENGNLSSTNPENGNVSNINDRIQDFEQQLETIANLTEVNLDELPDIRRLGLSNQELLELDNDLTLPAANNISGERAEVIKLMTEAEIQVYVNYVEQRSTYEQTKGQLQQNQLEIRSLEEAYTPEVKEQLVQLLAAQEVLRAQLKSQKQALLQVKGQQDLEALLLANFRPQVTTTTTTTTAATSTTTLGSSPVVAFQMQERPNTTAPLPVGLPCPEGLVFRVQVGAFRKPVPAERFREFTPVDGKVLANGLTVYMAGYFQSSAEALQQQNLIRTLGYTDAFVVAYQNCTRMSLAQGRALEGRTPVANTAVVAQNSKFAGPGQGLYYSVQVGVYNRPITSEAQIGLTELIEAQTAKGQYRYASGKFANLNDAKLRQQQAVKKGIKDAFIVAYYQGKRIDLAQAKLLAQSGIAFESFQPSAAPQVISTALQQQVAALQLPQVKAIQLPDPICRYELRCTDCKEALTRFNRVGVFVYDDQKEMLVSALQKESQWSVVQHMYLKEMRKRSTNLKGKTQTLLLEESGIDGAFVDWLLRQHNGYELFIDDQGQTQLRYILPTEE
jgi:hypothetical protein